MKKKMGRWFRAYDETLDNMKVQQLPAELFKAWFNLLCLTSKNGGILPDIPEIAFRLRLSREEDADSIISELTKRGLIDETKSGLRPHDWNVRQRKSDLSTERGQRFRARARHHGNGFDYVSEADEEGFEVVSETG